MVNCLLYLHWLLPPSFGLTIITLAILIQSVFVPATVLAIQRKRLVAWMVEATMKLEKRSGRDSSEAPSRKPAPRHAFWVDPLGQIPRQKLLEIPIWLTLIFTLAYLADSPEASGRLADDLYFWLPSQMAELGDSVFLWMDLTTPDHVFVMPLLVFATRLASQAVVVTLERELRPSVRSLSFWLTPVGLSVLAASLPSGVALCWAASWIIALGVYSFASLSYVPPKPFPDLMRR